jgi:hypothetical protein
MSDDSPDYSIFDLEECEFIQGGRVPGSDSGESVSLILASHNDGPDVNIGDAVQDGTDDMDTLSHVVPTNPSADPSAHVRSSLGDFASSTEKASKSTKKAPAAKPAQGAKKKAKEAKARRAPDNRVRAYVEFLRNWVSHPAENLYLHQVSFWDLRPKNMDEVEYTTPRHRMLIQKLFELPGFTMRAVENGKCRDDDGTEMIFPVYIPYAHRRLWISFLASPHLAGEEHGLCNHMGKSIVASRVGSLMDFAWVRYDLEYDNSGSRHFARRVSNGMKKVDDGFKDWLTTTDVQFALKIFTEGRRAYLESRSDGDPVYVGRKESNEYFTQQLADRFLEVMDKEAHRNQTRGPVPTEVEEDYAFDSDPEEESKSIVANSGYPNLVGW